MQRSSAATTVLSNFLEIDCVPSKEAREHQKKTGGGIGVQNQKSPRVTKFAQGQPDDKREKNYRIIEIEKEITICF
jgi:hypothetical protein